MIRHTPRRPLLLPLFALFLLGMASPTGISGQIHPVLVAEARAGILIPVGHFGREDSALDVDAGPHFAIGGRLDLTDHIGLFAGYQHARFGCSGCPSGLDDRLVLQGIETGVRLAHSLALNDGAGQLWARGAMLHQKLGFSGFGERLDSDSAFGAAAALGIGIPLGGGFELNPGAGYQYLPARFQFSSFPERRLTVSAFSLDLAVAFRF